MGYPQKHNVIYGHFVYVDEDMWRANNSKTYQRLVEEYGASQIPKVGTIKNSWNERGRAIKYGVAFEKIQNSNSKDGLYWFDAEDIEAGIEKYFNMLQIGKDESYHFCLDLFSALNKKEGTTMQASNSMDPIKKVIFSGPCTIVLWGDRTKTMVRCSEDDFYDPEKAVMMAYLKKHFGYSNTQMSKWLQKYTEGAEEVEVPKKSKDIYSPLYNAINAFRRLGTEICGEDV